MSAQSKEVAVDNVASGDHFYLTGNFAPSRMEIHCPDADVEGEIPKAIDGTFFAASFNHLYPPKLPYHWFEGDGMMNAFIFREGRVQWTNRFVRTERYKDMLQAGKSLYTGITSATVADMSSQEGYVEWRRRVQTANTNIISFADRLLIPWEAGLPYELDPVTLETKETFDFNGTLELNMTAHPKIDPDSGELFFFAHRPIPPYIMYYVADPDGTVKKAVPVEAPFHSFMHDFLITKDYAIFPVLPMTMGVDNLERTGNFVGWEPEKNSHIGIMPRYGDSDDAKWFEVDAFAQFHFYNAYNEGSKVVMLIPAFDNIYHFDLQGSPAPIDPHELNCELIRWTFDLETGESSKEIIDDLALDYHRVDPRFVGRKWQHTYSNAWIANNRPPKHGGSWPMNGIVHYNHETGERKLREFRHGTWTAPEPAFVPRSPTAPEGDGYLLSLVYREEENRSDIEILDTQDITAEPIATVKLPSRVVYGAHGQFAARQSDGSLSTCGV